MGRLTRRTNLGGPSGPAPSGLPAWMQGQAVGEWREIEGTANLSGYTLPDLSLLGDGGSLNMIIDGWGALALDPVTSELFSPAGGGHNNYLGNQVLGCPLADEEPEWYTRRAPSVPPATDTDYGSDGRPVSRHGYYSPVCIPNIGRIMLFGAGGRATDGFFSPVVDGFRVTDNDWDAASTYPNMVNASEMGYAVCHNPLTDAVYVWAGHSLRRWNCPTTPGQGGSWTTIDDFADGSGYYAACAFDTNRGRMYITGGDMGSTGYTVDAATNAITSRAGVSGGECGMVYEPVLDAFLWMDGSAGGGVTAIDAETFSTSPLSTTGGSGIPAAVNGVYRKFLFAPALGGVVYLPRYSSNIWFLRTH